MKLTPEQEAIAKAEHEADPANCVYPHPEHDVFTIYEDAEIWQGQCKRCGAEMEEDLTDA